VVILEQSNLATSESLRSIIKDEIELFEKRKIIEREEKYNIEFDRHVRVTTIILLVMSTISVVLISFSTIIFTSLISLFLIVYPLLVISSYCILKSKKNRNIKEVWISLNFLIFLPLFFITLVLFFFL
jgi:hypothetical protein